MYVEFRKGLTPHYGLAWAHIALGHLTWLLALVAMIVLEKTKPLYGWLAAVPGGVLVGYTVSALHLFMHEASHYHLAPSKRWNDILSNIFLGPLIGMETNYYRSVHFVHHRLIGTHTDTERSYFNALTLRFILETLTGLRVLRVMGQRKQNIETHYPAGKSIVFKNNVMFVVAALLHSVLIGGLLYKGFCATAAAWAAGMGIWFPFFAMFRQILEHRTPQASAAVDYSVIDQGASHRMFGEGLIASTLGAAGFNRHLIHHWDPSVSYTRLKDVEMFLADTPLQAEVQAAQTTYLKTFWLLFNKK